MVRHGYTQCTACHVSPAGGGILTPYGRELSGDLLSTWAGKNEAQFLHSKVGAKLAEKGFLFGGDVRGIQTRTKTSKALDGKLFLMQAELQGAYATEKFTGVVSVGEIKDPLSRKIKGDFNSTMYYGYLKFSEALGLRAGRFLPAYGLNLPDHTLAVKQGLGFYPGLEYDSAEVSYLSEHWTILATAARSLPNVDDNDSEYSKSANVSYGFLNRMRVGASYWDGNGPGVNRRMYGLNAILGFTSRFYNLTEIDFKHERTQDGFFGLTQLAYEVYKGIIPYLQYQQQQSKLTSRGTLTKIIGAGFHFYSAASLRALGRMESPEYGKRECRIRVLTWSLLLLKRCHSPFWNSPRKGEKMRILGIIAMLFSIHAFADDAKPAAKLQCHVMILATDLPNGSGEADYETPVVSGSHGGEENNFKIGNHQITVNSDGKWLAINWVRKGIIIATATSVRTEDVQNAMVLILFNPNNQDEQASVNCSVK